MNTTLFYTILTDFMTDNKESVYRLAYSYVRHPQNAMDIVQEAIQKALTKRHSLNKSESIKSWFYRILVNTALDHLRKEKKFSFIADEILEQHGVTDHDVIDELHVEMILEKMPLIYREVIVLRFFEDMRLEDIAIILDVPLSTIKTRLYQALKMLRITME